MARAFSGAMPCVSLISRRTVSPAAGVTGPSSRFFTGTPRLTSLDCSTSRSAFILKSLSATRVSVAWARSKVRAAFEPLKSERWATSLVAWCTALSTSWRSAPVERPKDAREAIGEDLVVGAGVLGIGEVVEQLIVLPRGEGGVEREMGLRDGQGLRDLLLGDVHPFGDLLDRGLTTQLLEQGRGALTNAVQRAGAVQRNAHDAGLLGQGLEDRLADPPHGVRDELDPLGLVELVGRADQSQVAFVDEVGERHALVLVLLRDRDHEEV